MTLRELLSSVAPSQLARAHELPLTDVLHDGEGSDAPLLVRLFTAIGTWIGAAMVAVIFAALEIYEVVPLAIILAIALFAIAISLSRRQKRSLALTQLIWAMALGAHGLLLGACAELDLDALPIALSWTLLNAIMIFLIRTPSFALASAVCAVGFATWSCYELDISSLWVALPIVALTTALWIYEVPIAARLGQTWSALAYGLPLGVVGPLTLISLDGSEPSIFAATGLTTTITTLVLIALIAAVMLVAKREQRDPLAGRPAWLAAIALLTVLAARHVPGLSLALLLLLLAHLRRSTSLQIIAAIELGGFLFFFYYQLETSLLSKSLWVLGTGAALLIGALLSHLHERAKGKPQVERRSRWLAALVLALASSGLIVGASLDKERILAEGELVLLPLAPVDPRALIQGDYMQLRYQLENELLENQGLEVHFDPSLRPDLPRHGRMVIQLDGERVGHLVRIDDGTPLAPNQVLLEYRMRGGWDGQLRIGAESFLFEEGKADLYQTAAYGELIVAADGEAILVGLRDANKRPLGVRLHE